MKAHVTGGGGFLGRAITEILLGRGDHVRIFSRQRYPVIESLGAEGMQGDIRNLDDLTKACMGRDTVFHTAALPGVWGDMALYTAVNVTGTRNVIEAAKRRGVGKLVFTSSPSVVFNMRDENGIDETAPYPPRFYNPYSETKARAEEMVLKTNGADGLLTCSLRPHLIWGPRDNHLIPRLIERARKRQLRIVGKGRNKVALTYIENAAVAHLLACDAMSPKRVAGEAYFISDEEPVALWEWINALLEQLGIPQVTRHVSAPLAYAAGYCMEQWFAWRKRQDEPRMTRFLARALSCSHYYNLAKAKRDFGYHTIVDNAEGVQRTVAYFRDESSPQRHRDAEKEER